MMAVSSSFQKLLLLIKRVRRLSGVALSGFPVHSPALGTIFTKFGPGRWRGTRSETRARTLCLRAQKPDKLSLIENLAQLASNQSTASSP